MPSELEESAEAASELIHEEAASQSGAHSTNWVAFSTVVMALISALGALLAGITANEALHERTKEIMEVSYMERDRISAEILQLKHDVLSTLGAELDKSEVDQIRAYQEEANKLEIEVESEELIIEKIIFEHELFAVGVTLLSIGITLSGISMLARRRLIFIVSLVFAIVGTGVVGYGVFLMFF